MVKVSFPLSLVLTCALFASPLSSSRGDSITLKSGEEFEGFIQNETETHWVMTVQVSDGITDEMTFEKSEVKGVVKTPRDNLAYESLQRFRPGPNSLSLAAYDSAIAAFQGFLKKFPDSGHHQNAKNQIETLKEEKARVAKKELKWNNRWYTAAEAQANSYQINAQQLLAQARELATRGDYVGALNVCDRLERAFPGSTAFPESVKFALSVIPRLNGEIDRMIPIIKTREQQFSEGIVLAVEPEKSRMIAAHDDAIAKAEAAVTQSTAKWKPFLPISAKSTTDLKQTIGTELTRLKGLDLAPMEKSIAMAEEAAKEIAARNAEPAEAKLKEAQSLWTANEMLVRLNPALATLKAELAAPAPTPEPVKEAVPAAPAAPAAQAATAPAK